MRTSLQTARSLKYTLYWHYISLILYQSSYLHLLLQKLRIDFFPNGEEKWDNEERKKSFKHFQFQLLSVEQRDGSGWEENWKIKRRKL